ncbi:hypothetical protein IGI04_029510 [Brassica rapa subsp. trilocularis]|uniref:Uncharacterized protein n=1 Tax=Brassica rapa subsp. trilocularis TaxID=1813537 RepID=A0ABQ7LN66_BRACM|nr:hypothetical protein IGI04_029510 [Brassica rapa subsp. trilocularis]
MKAATRRRQGFQLTRWRRRRLQEEKTKAVTGGGEKDAKKAPELRKVATRRSHGGGVRHGSLTQIGRCGLWRRKVGGEKMATAEISLHGEEDDVEIREIFFRFNFML